MRVWIDQDLCTGDGLCEDHCADAFKLLEDGIAYVAELGVALNDPGGAGSLARVAPRDRQSVLRAAEVCPGGFACWAMVVHANFDCEHGSVGCIYCFVACSVA